MHELFQGNLYFIQQIGITGGDKYYSGNHDNTYPGIEVFNSCKWMKCISGLCSESFWLQCSVQMCWFDRNWDTKTETSFPTSYTTSKYLLKIWSLDLPVSVCRYPS